MLYWSWLKASPVCPRAWISRAHSSQRGPESSEELTTRFCSSPARLETDSRLSAAGFAASSLPASTHLGDQVSQVFESPGDPLGIECGRRNHETSHSEIAHAFH